MEATKKKYTIETLLPLNLSYDRGHTLTQADVDMANRLVEVIENSRSEQIPKVGDRIRYVDRHSDFSGYGLLERAVENFVMSYNFDDSDPMTDYFCTNFYLTLGIGKWSAPYRVVLPRLDTGGRKPGTFRHPEGSAHKAMSKALEKGRFDFIPSGRHSGYMVYGTDNYGRREVLLPSVT